MTIFETNKSIRKMSIIGPRCRERFLSPLKGGPLRQLHVGGAGVSDLRGQYRMVRPRPTGSVVLGTLAGRAKLFTDDGMRLLKPGDLLLAPAGFNHCYELIRGRYWRIVWFNISGDIPFDAVRVLKVSFLPKLEREFLDLIEETAVDSFLGLEARSAKESYIAVFLRRILNLEKQGQAVAVEKRLRELWNTVMADPSRPWTLDELADLAGYSAGHLNRICRAYYAAPAVRHLTRLKMEHAAQLLATGTLKLHTIARRCGYDNPFAFSVAFKRQFGVCPSRFHI